MRRLPWLTGIVFAVTAGFSVAQFAVPSLLVSLERTPAGLSGEWYRTVTALLVQDGGVAGTISNLAFLAVLGVIAEQTLSRPRWLLLYLGTGIAAEFVAYAWQPTGAGNSIAICGLSGGLAVVMLRGDEALPWPVPVAQLLWAGVLAGTAGGLLPAMVICVTAIPVTQVLRARGLPVGKFVGAAVLACGVALAIVADIHGAALLIGALLGALALAAGVLAPTGPATRGERDRRRAESDPAASGPT
jgi:membrane associated rhomboid family serine protease